MVGSLAELAALFGLGGALGALLALSAAGKRFATRLSGLAALAEKVAKDPLHADLAGFARQAQDLGREAESLLGMLRQVVKR